MARQSLDILVVDDDKGMRDMMWAMLSKEGHNPLAVESVEEALTQFMYADFHVAFVDHYLPGENGLYLCEYLYKRFNGDGKNYNTSYLEIALITAAVDEGLDKQAEELGITFIAKPFLKNDLLNVIDKFYAEVNRLGEIRLLPQDKYYAPNFSMIPSTENNLFKLSQREKQKITENLKRGLNLLRTPKNYSEHLRNKTLFLLQVLQFCEIVKFLTDGS